VGAPSTASQARARSRRSAGESREAILAAAITEFARTGYRGTSTEAIAARVGVSQPYVFRLFGSKRALFIAAGERSYKRIEATFRAEAETAIREGRDPFVAMGEGYVRLLADRDELMLQMQSYIAADDPEIRRFCQGNFESLTTFLESLPGADPVCVSGFLAAGMLLNVAAAIDLFSLAENNPWAQRCLEGVRTRSGTPNDPHSATER
jgi:AcrR family transcriptional regulator